MVYLPDYVLREPDHMRDFAQGITSQSGNGPDPLFWSQYKEALRALRKIPELLLIDRAATALRDNSTLLEILSPFYGLLYNLLMTSGVEIPPELQAPDMADETADQYGAKETRCSQPTEHDCRGMCGAGCNCWKWVCGDCCFHQSCYEHDLCCKHAPWSSYCLLPFGIFDGLRISCERFFVGFRNDRFFSIQILIFRMLCNNAKVHISSLGCLWWISRFSKGKRGDGKTF